jgi:hypothetical protein
MRRRIHVAVTLPIHLLDKYIYYIKRHKAKALQRRLPQEGNPPPHMTATCILLLIWLQHVSSSSYDCTRGKGAAEALPHVMM